MTEGQGHNIIAAILAEHREVLASHGKALSYAIKCGELLLQQKKDTKRGEWGRFLTNNCAAISWRTVDDYILLAKNKEMIAEAAADSQSSANLSIAGALKLIRKAKPKPRRKSTIGGKSSKNTAGGVENPTQTQAQKPDLATTLKDIAPDEVAIALGEAWEPAAQRELIKLLSERNSSVDEPSPPTR
jgi:hypothetical protein